MISKKIRSLRYAMSGLRIAMREEHNFRFEIALAILAVAMGAYFKVSTTEWLFIVGVCGLVFTAELLNTALEELCDMLKPTHDPHVGKIKDLAAAAVLVASYTSLLVGMIIFVPKILSL
jgi:diacylglycerol kinase